jgi:hypothetical protein
MMNASAEFDLIAAIHDWRLNLSQSPQFRPENLNELESHLRDSVASLQSKGLSAEESFLIGARRVGSASALEREFAAENGGRGWRNVLRRLSYRYLNKVVHALVLLYFTTGCFLLWGVLQVGRMAASVNARVTHGAQPGFTQLGLGLMPYWWVPPALALLYCGFVWTRPACGRSTWFGFFAIATAALLLLALPALVAAGLPLIDYLNRLPRQ